jgi:type IV pilus assembly protein PilX
MMAHKMMPLTAKNQGGAVLAMTLILLVLMSLLAISALKGSISGEQVSKNMRTTSVALQSAETALRLCEDAVRTGKLEIGQVAALAPVKVQYSMDLAAGEMPTQWKTRANWVPDPDPALGMITAIPKAQVVDGARPLPFPPRCMVEQYRLPRLDPDTTLSDPFLVTAVGYSPDYTQNAAGDGLSGSEVWVQSVLQP